MNLKKLIIPAIVLTVLGGAVKYCDTFLNVYGSGFFMSSRVCNCVFAVIVILLYAVGYALSISDRKKEFHIEPQKNFWCGAFGFVASITLIGGGVIGLLSLNGENLLVNLTEVAGGFILLYEACISFTGQNGLKKIPVAPLILPIWCTARFVDMFVDYTHYALGAREIFDLIEVGFMVMFLFYQAMFFAGINNRIAVRRATVYGTVFMMLALIVPIDLFIKMAMGGDASSNIDTLIVEPTITNIIAYTGDLALCAYAFFFTREIVRNAEKNLLKVEETSAVTETAEKTEAVSEPETEEKTEADSEPETEEKTEADSEPETEEKTEADSEPETEEKTEADSEPETEEKTEAVSEPETKTVSKKNKKKKSKK